MRKKQIKRNGAVMACIGVILMIGIFVSFPEKTAARGENEPITPIVEVKQITEQENTPEAVSIGVFTITAYCPCEECSGPWGTQTSTGVKAKAGTTIAVDPIVIPYGTTVIINGKEYTAQDTLARYIIERYKSRIIDIYFDSHKEVDQFGKQTAEIFVKY